MIKFFNSNFCPFGQRAWLALLEKQVEHEYVHINYFNKSLESTKEFLSVSPEGTVPAALVPRSLVLHEQGKGDKNELLPIYDSLPFIEFVEENFKGPALLPKGAYQRFLAREMIKVHGEAIVPAFYKLLMANNADKDTKKQLEEALTKALVAFNDDLKKDTSGPFALGSFYSLVDISIIPFAERIQALLPHYRNFDPLSMDQLDAYKEWYSACTQRESFKVSSANHEETALNSYPFASTERVAFLQEVYQVYALNDIKRGRQLLADAPHGVSTYTPPPSQL